MVSLKELHDAFWNDELPDLIMAADDPKSESRNEDYQKDVARAPQVVERKREWEHPQESNCKRKAKPVFTDLDRVPDPCRRNRYSEQNDGCESNNWRSKGIVHRLKDTKEVIYREKQ